MESVAIRRVVLEFHSMVLDVTEGELALVDHAQGVAGFAEVVRRTVLTTSTINY